MQNTKRKALTQGLLIGAAAALVTVGLYTTGSLDWVEAKTWDWRVRLLAKPGPATSQVCTIAVDQNALDAAEDLIGITWKWPREVYSAILSFCQRGGAKVVAFDLVFSESSELGVDDDVRFGEAIAGGPPCVVALTLKTRDDAGATEWPEGISQVGDRSKTLFAGNPGLRKQLAMPRASFPVPEIATNVTRLGNVAAVPDADALFRRAPIGRIFDDQFVPSLGLAAYLAANPDTRLELTEDGMHIGDHVVPLDARGDAILRFRGKTQTHTMHSAAAVLQSELRILEGGSPIIDPAVFKDRYVLFGLTATGLMDLKPTPVGHTYPGVEVHATFLDNLLSDDFARQLPTPVTALLIIVAALVAGIIGRHCQNWHQTTLGFLVLLALPPLAGLLAYPARLWLPVAPLIVAAGLALLTAVIVNYALEGHQKRFIKGAFKQYLSPVVIDKLMQNPDALQLGGEEKELSIFFSDIQGFTTISEGLTPTELTSLLNEYLTAMTDVIHEEGGTIDKYEGDAIIAFWNAPLEQNDHAERAVRAALRCQATLASLRPRFKEHYGQDIHVRIGLNTGRVVVGNMGSNQRFDYTFLGDAGNLAARLEGINKQFGTYLMISEYTRSAIASAFPTRELSRVQVVGKTEPVTVYEPFLPEAFVERHDALKAFADALQLYYGGDFENAETQFRALAETDPPARIYADRCSRLASAPPAEWQGVWAMTEK